VFDLPRKGTIEEGADADLVLVVDWTTPARSAGEAMHTKVDWTPFEGFTGSSRRGRWSGASIVYKRDLSTGDETFADHQGENVRDR